MNKPPRDRWKILVLTQIFTLFLILALPLLIRLLTSMAGKVLYALLALICVLVSIELRRLLQGAE
jgi:hypothetical protein